MAVYGGCNEKELDRNYLEAILSNTVAGIALVSPNSEGIKLEYTNDAFFKIFGYTREEYEFLDEQTRMTLFNYDDFMTVITHINTEYTPGKTVQFECRINKKGGETSWALFTATRLDNKLYGNQKFVCNIVDITDLKKLQLEIQAEKDRYELVEEISDDIVFTYDVIEDTFDCSPKILNSLRRYTHIDNAIERVTYGDVFDHRDVPAFIEALSSALSGRKVNSFDARIINLRGDGVWHRMKFASVYDSEGNPIKFVGTMRNIDSEKKEKTRILSQAETDPLTGCMNKIATGMKINDVLRDYATQNGTMLLIDIDNFRNLNDNYGHRECDDFLKRFCRNLSSDIRTNDILGRVGGDEFVVFINGIGDEPGTITKKANDILKICNETTIGINNEKIASCSVGTAIFPKDGSTYRELYEKAEGALFKAKSTGKNCCAFAD